MKKWSMPDSYFGAFWPDYYVFLGQNRDSDALTRSNFRTALKALGGEDGDDVVVVRESHWACGWVEWIGILDSNEASIKLANEMESRIEDYPVLDEEDFSSVEDDDCQQTWANCFDVRDRLDYFRRHSYTASSLADLMAAIRGDWYAAANMLHCPSDLIY